MATKFYNNNWRMPKNANQSKASNFSMEFDSAGGESIQATKDLSSLTACSISCWVKFDFTETSYQYACMVGNAAGAGEMLTIAKQKTTGGDANKFYVWDGGTAHTTTKVAADNTWYHAVVTQTGTTIKVYIDNVEVSGGGFTGSALNLDNGATKPTITLGAYFVTGFNHELEGRLDQVAIFDYALSASDISDLYGNSTDGVGNPMDLTTAPVAYYKLGDLSAYNGTNYLVPNAISTNFSNYALDFDGTNDYIDCGNPTELQITGALTLSAWIKSPALTGTNQGIIYKDDNTNRCYKMQLAGLSGVPLGRLQFSTFNSGVVDHTDGTTNLADNNWHHIVAVYTPSTSVVLYVDGVVQTTNTTSIPASIDNDPADFEIGRKGDGTLCFDGKISNVAIWNSALSAPNITTLYNSGKPSDLSSFSPAPVAWWQLGENSYFDGSNWIVLDEIGTNNGTSSGMSEDDLVNGVGTTANGVSSGMGTTNIKGDAPYSTNNAISYNMGVTAKETSTP